MLAHRPTRALLEAVAEATGAELLRPWRGLPMLNGGVDASYDSVASAETLEVGVRVAAPRSRIVLTGVARPRRFEWTPVYFKEIALVGSNAFGLETFGERRQHAMEWYLEWLQTRGLDATATLTHRFALEDWPRALLVCFDQARSGAVEVLFDFRGGQGTSGA